jgi:hypothetical protein
MPVEKVTRRMELQAMMRLRLAICVGAASLFAVPAAAQVAGTIGGRPSAGTDDSAALAIGDRQEESDYQKLMREKGIQKVGEGKKSRKASKAARVPATAADIVVGAAVRDVNGVTLGKIESIDGEDAILTYTGGKIRFPMIGFGKDAQGLLINLSTQDFLALVEKAKAAG